MDKWYGDQWNPHNQFTTYMYADSELTGEKCRDGIVQCLHFNKNIEKVRNYFPFTRSDRDLEEWKEETIQSIKMIEGMWKEYKEIKISEEYFKTEYGMFETKAICTFPKHTNACFMYRKPCPYLSICSEGKVLMREKIVEDGFRVEKRKAYTDLEEKGSKERD